MTTQQTKTSVAALAVKKPEEGVDLRIEALAKPAKSSADIKRLFEDPRIKAQIAMAVPKHLTPDRLLKVVTSNVVRTPKLLECTQISLLQSVTVLGELGLEPGQMLGHSYLIPYSIRGTMTCSPMIGYQGYIELARRSGRIVDVEAEVIHANDSYRVRAGSNPRIDHEPLLEGDPGPLVMAYCFAVFQGGFRSTAQRMTAAQIEKARSYSKQPNGEGWTNSYDEMAKKTMIRRSQKTWPKSPEMAKAAIVDEGRFLQPRNAQEAMAMTRNGIIDLSAATDFVVAADEPDPTPPSMAVVEQAKPEPKVHPVPASMPAAEATVESTPLTPSQAAAVEAEVVAVTDELDKEVASIRAALAAAKTRRDVMALAGRIKALPEQDRRTLEAEYAARLKEVA